MRAREVEFEVMDRVASVEIVEDIDIEVVYELCRKLLTFVSSYSIIVHHFPRFLEQIRILSMPFEI